MGLLDKAKKCASDPGACAKGIVAGAQASRYNDVKYQRPENVDRESYQSGASMGHDARKAALNAREAGVGGVRRVGRAAGDAYEGAKAKGKDLFHCPPGSACSRQRAEEKDMKRYGIKPDGPDARKLYAQEMRKEAEEKKALREAKEARYQESTRGRAIQRARNIGGAVARGTDAVYQETKDVTLAATKKVVSEGRSRKGYNSVSVPGRGRGRPVGSGRGNYTHSGARYSQSGYVPGQSQPPQPKYDPIGDIEFQTKSRVKSLDQQMDRFF